MKFMIEIILNIMNQEALDEILDVLYEENFITGHGRNDRAEVILKFSSWCMVPMTLHPFIKNHPLDRIESRLDSIIKNCPDLYMEANLAKEVKNFL